MILDRSLTDRTFYYKQKYENRMITLERLADGGFLKNNRQMIVILRWPSFPRFCQVVRSMTKLEKLEILDSKLTLTQDVPQLFQSCPKLTELRMKLVESQNLEMNEDLRNDLRSGFQRLQLFELDWEIDGWPVIQKIFM
jgi:hypothetical protein